MVAVKARTRLLAYTPQPETAIAKAARLCYSASQISDIEGEIKTPDAMIRGLIKRGHLSPLEHASFTFGIEGVSRAFLAQITRHRIASFSVQSQRYVRTGEELNYIVPQSVKKLGAEYTRTYQEQMQIIEKWYREWIETFEKCGITGEAANEDARFVLPNAAETRIIVTMNARELLHFFELRCCKRAQWEIRSVAWKMLSLVEAIAPNVFEQAGPKCLRGECTEREYCKGE